MKFMKLGSRPDTFYTTDDIRSVSSEVASDLEIEVKGCRYLLHKFPLLSKCLRLQKLCSETPESSPHQTVKLIDFPGGIESFELCARFCYGITITLSANNIVSALCAAEYLKMTEDVEKGNLLQKLDVFFVSCILQGWRDSIVALQSTKTLPLRSEELGITTKCIESITSKILGKMALSYNSHSRRDNSLCNETEISQRRSNINWWVEDLAELSIDLYWRTLIAIKSSGKLPGNLIGEGLKAYASRWLPKDANFVDIKMQTLAKYKLLLESIVSLLPPEKGCVSCSFLLKLLKAANFLEASASKRELVKRVGLQLEEAKVSDLLIPLVSLKNDMGLYDVDLVITILEEFMLQGLSPPTSPQRSKLGYDRRRSRSAENIDVVLQESRRSSSASHSSKLKVAKLIDGYLQKIARDVDLSLEKFIALAEAIPEFSRLVHDDLYRAINIYLKAHPNLNKKERKRLCQILDCRRLSIEACTHAAQNEMLPLRVVVQVLFFEQARAAIPGAKAAELPSNIKALLASNNIDPSSLKSPNSSIKGPTLKSKLAEEEDDFHENDSHSDDTGRNSSKFKAFCAIPSRPKKMFSKFLSINRSSSEKN